MPARAPLCRLPRAHLLSLLIASFQHRRMLSRAACGGPAPARQAAHRPAPRGSPPRLQVGHAVAALQRRSWDTRYRPSTEPQTVLQVVRREAPPAGAPLGLPWPLRPEALAAPAAAALLLLAGSGPLGSQLHLGFSGSDGGGGSSALEQQLPRSAADAHLVAQRTWRQRQQLASAPSLAGVAAPTSMARNGAAPSSVGQPASSLGEQEPQAVAQPPRQQQRSSGADRPLVFDRQTTSALAACMVVSGLVQFAPKACCSLQVLRQLPQSPCPRCCPQLGSLPHVCPLLSPDQVAALANSAGIGGGAFIVPLMYLGLGFDIKDSTALSQAVIAVRAGRGQLELCCAAGQWAHAAGLQADACTLLNPFPVSGSCTSALG